MIDTEPARGHRRRGESDQQEQIRELNLRLYELEQVLRTKEDEIKRSHTEAEGQIENLAMKLDRAKRKLRTLRHPSSATDPTKDGQELFKKAEYQAAEFQRNAQVSSAAKSRASSDRQVGSPVPAAGRTERKR